MRGHGGRGLVEGSKRVGGCALGACMSLRYEKNMLNFVAHELAGIKVIGSKVSQREEA